MSKPTDDEQPVMRSTQATKWTVDCICEKCGWPWHMIGFSETPKIDIRQTVKCPNCGAAYTMELHHE